MSAILVFGLLFGDEGKGRMVDALVRRTGAREVVRFGGGPQAAHHVVAPDGRSHVFSQFGSGLLVPGTRARIARGMLVDPLALVREAQALAEVGVPDALCRLAVDPRCALVTPLQRLVGQMRELARGAARHGSCGRGVGEAARDAAALGEAMPRMGDLADPLRLRAKLAFLWRVKLDHAEQVLEEAHGLPALAERWQRLRGLDLGALAAQLAAVAGSGLRLERDEALAGPLGRGEPIVFEGAQGVLLDVNHGFRPHVTATDTTPGPGLRLLEELGAPPPLRLGVLRAYLTRHGAGPFPTEDASLGLADACNPANEWQGPLRTGWLDLVLLRYALQACGGADALAVTCLDRVRGPLRVATAYEGEPAPGPAANTLTGVRPRYRDLAQGEELPGLLASPAGLGVPIAARAHGPAAADTAWGPALPFARGVRDVLRARAGL